MSDLFEPSLVEMIAEADREIVARFHVYPRLVAAGKLKQAKADRQIQVMRAIAARLRHCAGCQS